jgi:D-alanyl-D-alanine carboxypeptidase
MHKKKLKFFAVFLCALLIAAPLLSVNASAAPPLPSTDGAPTVYLWNAEYNKTVISKSTDKKIYPASMTKIMTGLVAIELIEDKLDKKVTVST